MARDAGESIKKDKLNLFQKLSVLFFTHHKQAIIFFSLLVVAGALSYTTFLKREGFPAIQTPISIAGGAYFVDSQETIDKTILQPVNQTLLENEKVETVQSTARQNTFQLFAGFEESVGSAEGAQIVKDAFESNNLPDGVEYQVPTIDVSKYMNEYIILLSVYSEDGSLDLRQTQDRAADVTNELLKIDGTTGVEILEPFTIGLDQATGDQRTIQTGFSRYGSTDSADGSLTLRPSVVVGLKVGEDVDTIDYSQRVSDKIDELSGSAEFSDVTVAVSADTAPSILTQIASLQSNLLTGLLAVAMVSLLLITWRASIITALFMISVVLVTILILWAIGYTLNTITLFALVLSLGLFVDDATIIVEALDASKAKKNKPMDAIKEAIGKVGAASFAGTFTTVLVFLPMAFISGILGSFIRIMPITIITALITSLILSLTLIPVLAKFLLLNTPKKSRSPLGPLEAKIANKLGSLPLVFHRSRTKGVLLSIGMVGISVVFIFTSMIYAQKVSFNIFPPSKDSDLINLSVDYEPGTSIAEAESIADQIDAEVIGAVEPGLIESISYSVLSGSGELSNERSANALIVLKPFTERDIKSPEIIDSLHSVTQDISGARIRFGQLDAGPPAEEFPFKVQIFTPEIDDARRLSQDIESFLSGSEIERPNGTKAYVDATATNYFDSTVRIDGDRVFQVAAGFDADDTTALVQSAQTKVEEEFTDARLAEYGLSTNNLEFDFGQESENQESFASMGLVGMLSLFAMYLLLGLQFRSLLNPILIFLAIPFSLLGVFAGLYYTGNSLSFFVMIGVFGLIGIAVNNTILLTDYVNQERRAGKGVVDAISQATQKRFRPLVTTSTTTVVALLPLALSDPFWEALAFTIIFGLLSSTFLVVVAFPYYYLGFEWVRRGGRRLIRAARRSK